MCHRRCVLLGALAATLASSAAAQTTTKNVICLLYTSDAADEL